MGDIYLTPDFFGDFCCKMGECRHACCVGWPISFSMEDYFKLAGCECGEELRALIDRGVKVALEPTEDRYALITPRFDGECFMRLEDGRCRIHASLGEEALPQVCRLYPRGFRAQPGSECALANSCERVVELLYEREEAIRFLPTEIDITPPKLAGRLVSFPTLGRETEIRLFLIGCIQNRCLPLRARLVNLRLALEKVEEATEAGDEGALDALLSGTTVDTAEHGGSVEDAINAVCGLLDYLDGRSDSLKDYGSAARERIAGADDPVTEYGGCRKRFEKRFPKWEVFFEHLLANHMFFEQFPYQDRPVPPKEEYLSMLALYAVLRFVCVGYMAEHDGKDALIDACAAVFRLAEHSEFYRYSARTLEKMGFATADAAFSLTLL